MPQQQPIQQHIIGSNDNGIDQSKDISDYFPNTNNNADDLFQKNSNRKNSSNEFGEISLK